MILTEATLAELHSELTERLKMAHGKPVMITITHIDETQENKFQHWMCLNNEFPHDDIYKSLGYLIIQASDNHVSTDQPIVAEPAKEQLKVLKPVTLRG